jgi:hypothetical protein
MIELAHRFTDVAASIAGLFADAATRLAQIRRDRRL